MTAQFKLSEIIIPTAVARAGMTIGEVFEECVARDVSGIPFVDGQGKVSGRVSIGEIRLAGKGMGARHQRPGQIAKWLGRWTAGL